MSETIFNYFEKILKDVRWIYLGLFIILFITINIQVSIPARPTQMTIDYYNIVVGDRQGRNVAVMNNALLVWQAQEYQLNRESTIKYWATHGCCVVWVTGADTQAWDILWAKDVFGIPYDQDINTDPRYGVQFVLVPSTWDNAYVTVENFRGGGDRDLFGTSFSNLPGVANAKTGRDVYAYVGAITGGDYTVAYHRYGSHVLSTGCSGSMSVCAAWYGSKIVEGILLGLKGGIEMDQLLGGTYATQSKGQQSSFAFSAIGLYILAIVLAVNIVSYYSVQRRKRPLSMRARE